MARIVLLMDGVILREMVLAKERITIGRRPHNDLVIDNSAISAEHAVIVTMLHDAFLEDLNSTNGTRVNGQLIKKHFLKNNDVIELAKYKIRFVYEVVSLDVHRFLGISHKRKGGHYLSLIDIADTNKIYGDGNTLSLNSDIRAGNAVMILNGAAAGKKIELNNPLTIIGLPGKQVAVITKHGQSYNITHVEGSTCPLVNGKSISTSAFPIITGDIIELLDIQMEFMLQ